MTAARLAFCKSYSFARGWVLFTLISWHPCDARRGWNHPSPIQSILHRTKGQPTQSIKGHSKRNIEIARGGAAADFMDEESQVHNEKGFHNFRYHHAKQDSASQQHSEYLKSTDSSSTIPAELYRPPSQQLHQHQQQQQPVMNTAPSSSTQDTHPNPVYASQSHRDSSSTTTTAQVQRNSWASPDPTLQEPDMFDPELPSLHDLDVPSLPDVPSSSFSSSQGPMKPSDIRTSNTIPPPPAPPSDSSSSSSSSSPSLDLNQFNKELIFAGLKRLYRKKILPLELSSKYGHFHSPPLSPSDFDAKPMVLLLGQYSVGKTSFIQYLLGRDFPGIRIGPEPTTDRFTCILQGQHGDKVIPGAALCSQGDRPFRGLSPMGNNFLSRLEGIELMDAPILENITLVDTPGILSGSKQGSMGRNYDYDAVMKWFAERADLIIIMFDAHKLDISDELKRVIEMLKPHQDKIRVVLNKADGVSTQQLLRVYGALMWGLGKVMMTPEVCRVFVCSLWDAPLQNKEQAPLLYREKVDLFKDIAMLPQNAVMRRINELVKRARSVKVHAYIIHYLRKQMPYSPWGRQEKQRRLIDRLDRELIMCARRYELPRGDFPPVEPLRQALLEIKDIGEFQKLDKRLVKDMDKVFSVDIPELLEKARIP